MDEPVKKNNFRYVDDRGVLDQVFNADLPFEVKRCYVIYHTHRVIRAWHGHKKEWKVFYCPLGSFKIILRKMDGSERKEFVLSDKENAIVIVPPGWYNGFVNLVSPSILFVFSSSTLDESRNDDFRKPYNAFDENWEVKYR